MLDGSTLNKRVHLPNIVPKSLKYWRWGALFSKLLFWNLKIKTKVTSSFPRSERVILAVTGCPSKINDASKPLLVDKFVQFLTFQGLVRTSAQPWEIKKQGLL